MRCCCLDGYEVQGQIRIAQDPRKAIVKYLYTNPTTQLFYQGTGTAKKNEARRVASCRKMWVQFPSGRFALHVFNPMIMIVTIQHAYFDT